MRHFLVSSLILLSTHTVAETVVPKPASDAQAKPESLRKPKPIEAQLQSQLKPANAKTIAARNNASTAEPAETECDRLDDGDLILSSDDIAKKPASQAAGAKADAATTARRAREAERMRLGCHNGRLSPSSAN